MKNVSLLSALGFTLMTLASYGQLDQLYQPQSPGVFISNADENLSATDGDHLYTARTILIQPSARPKVMIVKTEAATGTVMWNYLLDANAGHINVTDIVYENNHIYFAGVSDVQSSNIVYIAALDAGSGGAVWSDYHSRDCWFNRAAVGFLNGNVVLGYSVRAGANSGQGFAETDPAIGFIEYDPMGNFLRHNWYWQDPTGSGNPYSIELLGLTETPGGLLCDGTIYWNSINPGSDLFHGMLNLDLELDDYATTGLISNNIFVYDCLPLDGDIVVDLDMNYVYSAYHGCQGVGGFVLSKSLRNANTALTSVSISSASASPFQYYPSKLVLDGGIIRIFGTVTGGGQSSKLFVSTHNPNSLALISYEEYEDVLSQQSIRSVGWEKTSMGTDFYCIQPSGAVKYQWSDLQQTCLSQTNAGVVSSPASILFREYGFTPELHSTLPTTPLNINQQPYFGLHSECDGSGFISPSQFKTDLREISENEDENQEVSVQWNSGTGTGSLTAKKGEFTQIFVTDVMGRNLGLTAKTVNGSSRDAFQFRLDNQAKGLFFITLIGPGKRYTVRLTNL